MLAKLEITRMAQGLATHAGQRMGIIAQNVANADTPGYKARDLPDFSKVYAERTSEPQRATRPGHFSAMASKMPEVEVLKQSDAPNGNSVSLEGEMVKAAEVRQQHDMALSIYSATSNIMKIALGRG